MKELLILRHAKSSWKEGGLSDHQRPLNKRGLRDAPRMGSLLSEHGVLPDVILSSDAVRARETALITRDAAQLETPLLLLRDLYLAGPTNYLQRLAELDDSIYRAMVVGHNPGLEELALVLTGEEVVVPTACLVHVQLPLEHWAGAERATVGRLLNVWKPRELPE